MGVGLRQVGDRTGPIQIGRGWLLSWACEAVAQHLGQLRPALSSSLLWGSPTPLLLLWNTGPSIISNETSFSLILNGRKLMKYNISALFRQNFNEILVFGPGFMRRHIGKKFGYKQICIRTKNYGRITIRPRDTDSKCPFENCYG